jgi:hypothetical protein
MRTAVNGGSELLIFVLPPLVVVEAASGGFSVAPWTFTVQPTCGDRSYLVLAKPNVIMNNIRLSEDWRLQELALPVARALTTTPRRPKP